MSIDDITGNPEDIAGENLEQTASTARRPEDNGEDGPYMPRKEYKKDEYPENGVKEEYLVPKSPDLGAPAMGPSEDLKYDPFIKLEEEEKSGEDEKEVEEEEESEEGEDE